MKWSARIMLTIKDTNDKPSLVVMICGKFLVKH